jgi:ATP-dependent Clp protease protease subunit
MALVRARVATTCFGQAFGTAAAVVACGTGRRRATPNATVSLRCDDPGAATGTATQVATQAEFAAQLRTRLAGVLEAATGRSADEITAEMDSGAVLDAPGAVAAGLVDEVTPRRS